MSFLPHVTTLGEVLEALKPAWALANKTDDEGVFLRPDYRQALDDAWTDIVVAVEARHRREAKLTAPLPLNVAMVWLRDEEKRDG